MLVQPDLIPGGSAHQPGCQVHALPIASVFRLQRGTYVAGVRDAISKPHPHDQRRTLTQFQRKCDCAFHIILIAAWRAPEQKQMTSLVAKINTIQHAAVFVL